MKNIKKFTIDSPLQDLGVWEGEDDFEVFKLFAAESGWMAQEGACDNLDDEYQRVVDNDLLYINTCDEQDLEQEYDEVDMSDSNLMLDSRRI